MLVFVVPGGCTSDCPGGGAATDGPDLPRADDAGIGVPGGPTVPGTSWVLISQKKSSLSTGLIKFLFSKKATKIDKIFTVDLTVTTYCQIVGGLLRKREL